MLTEGQTTHYDGFGTLERGMDSGRAPSLIGPNQAAFLINANLRTGFVENRPGLFHVELSGDDFQLGRFQGASAYISAEGVPFILASIGGQIIRIDPISRSALNLSTSSGLSNPSNLPKAWFCQAEIYLIIQDNSSLPLIFDGAVLRQANPIALGGDELPTGNAMEYNNGRLWVAYPDRRTFGGGNLAYSETGDVSDVLKWTQNEFLTSGSFALPSNAGFITSLRSLAVQDSVLGQGPLVVFGQYGAATINAPFSVELWQNTDSPIAAVGLLSPGPTSQEATVSVNGDLWYRAPDGLRTFMIARRDHGTWVNTPVSREMDRVLNRDDQHLLDHASAVVFDNRLLTTCSPYRATVDGEEYGVAFRGLSVLDFAPVSSMFQRDNPVWNGLWTGLNILQILKVNCYGVERCFLFILNDCQEIELWELSKANKFDNLVDPITWTLETRSMGFQDQAEFLKQLERTEVWIENLVGALTYTIQYRPDRYKGWVDLDSGSFCAASGMCDTPTCTPPVAPVPQYRPRKISSAPNRTQCEECVNKTYRTGFEFEFRLTLSGAARVRRFRAVASDVPEKTTGGCLGEESECCSESVCEPNPFAYTIANECD